ncbi:hypothetical protein, partial [Actinoplanes italicus]|uniref:hypothetical protein n=1 Tax=Actinoplanes italicus TaxID=113567 RepID=UPI001940AE19
MRAPSMLLPQRPAADGLGRATWPVSAPHQQHRDLPEGLPTTEGLHRSPISEPARAMQAVVVCAGGLRSAELHV